MSFSRFATFASVVAFASKAAAHGTVQGLVAEGVYYQGYNANFQYMQEAPVVVGWSTPENQGNGPITPDAYADPDIVCHLGATNAGTYAKVAAGGVVELQWTAWPASHHGPVLDYLAKCNNDCTTVDKTTLEFFKIGGEGLVDGTAPPGTWADDTLIANNNSWTVTIPTDIAPGNYVLRHEIIALHAAGETNGAQNYPQCFNLEISGSGTAAPSGVLGTALYTATEPGILVNIYQTLTNYTIPGPALYSGAISMTQHAQPAATGVDTESSATVVATTAASASLVAVAAETSVVTAPASSVPAGITAPAGSRPSGESGTTPASNTSKSACKVKTAKPSKSVCKAKTNQASATRSADNTLPSTLARRQHARDIIPHMARQEQDGFATQSGRPRPSGAAHPTSHHDGHGAGHAKPTGSFTRGEETHATGSFGTKPTGTRADGSTQLNRFDGRLRKGAFV